MKDEMRQKQIKSTLSAGYECDAANSIPMDLEPFDRILIHKDVMYQHQTAQVNYTTYDVRRAQDIINPNTTRRDIMVLNIPQEQDTDLDDSTEGSSKFAYAQVLGIFHVNVFLASSTQPVLNCHPHRLEFLWVRWYDRASPACSWRFRKLDRLCFPPLADEGSFGFIDPRDIVRACHIAPAFSAGKVHRDGVGISVPAKDYQDWSFYFVMRCVWLT
jgi:hypothetical protein